MADDLRRRATAARKLADKAERDRLAANVRARDLAAKAAHLEQELDQREQRRLEMELGPPRSAPVNQDASTSEELAAARAAGVRVDG